MTDHPHRQPGTVPVLPDATLDALGESFLAHGGAPRLGSFEAFVQLYRQCVDPRAHARAMQRHAIDHLGRSTHARR